MKKRYLIMIPILSLLFSTTVHAEKSAREKWYERYNQMQEYTMEIYNDDDLYSNYTPPEEIKTKKEVEEKNKTSKKKTSTKSNTNTDAKGWVYSVDEIHITGTPTDERGYTKAGDYGVIEK